MLQWQISTLYNTKSYFSLETIKVKIEQLAGETFRYCIVKTWDLSGARIERAPFTKCTHIFQWGLLCPSNRTNQASCRHNLWATWQEMGQWIFSNGKQLSKLCQPFRVWFHWRLSIVLQINSISSKPLSDGIDNRRDRTFGTEQTPFENVQIRSSVHKAQQQ